MTRLVEEREKAKDDGVIEENQGNIKDNINEKEGPSESYVDTAVVDVEPYNIGYRLLEHWSKFGYVVVDIVGNTVDVRAINLGIPLTSGGKK